MPSGKKVAVLKVAVLTFIESTRRVVLFCQASKKSTFARCEELHSLDIQTPPEEVFLVCFQGSEYLLSRCLDV